MTRTACKKTLVWPKVSQWELGKKDWATYNHKDGTLIIQTGDRMLMLLRPQVRKLFVRLKGIYKD